MTKAKISANYIFKLRARLLNVKSDEQYRGDTDIHGDSAQLSFYETEFAYPQRPLLKVLKGINLEVSGVELSGERYQVLTNVLVDWRWQIHCLCWCLGLWQDYDD